MKRTIDIQMFAEDIPPDKQIEFIELKDRIKQLEDEIKKKDIEIKTLKETNSALFRKVTTEQKENEKKTETKQINFSDILKKCIK